MALDGAQLSGIQVFSYSGPTRRRRHQKLAGIA
jgi:hypothetical protein